MTQHYTDADLMACAKQIDNPTKPGAIAESVLDAVAPAIAARVLREVAEQHRTARTSTQEPIWPAELDFLAGEIERGAL